jgi:DNA invertase Pin-like site-specific DNA recombinase
MSKTAKKKKPTADEIAEMAMSGKDISRYFTNKGEMRPPVKRVNVDFTLDMIKELDAVARELNISRQAVIKAYLRQALDQHYLARQSPQ